MRDAVVHLFREPPLANTRPVPQVLGGELAGQRPCSSDDPSFEDLTNHGLYIPRLRVSEKYLLADNEKLLKEATSNKEVASRLSKGKE